MRKRFTILLAVLVAAALSVAFAVTVAYLTRHCVVLLCLGS